MNVFLMQNSIVRPLGRDMQNVLIGFVGEHEARTFFVRTRDDLTGYTVGLVIDDVDCGAMTKAPMPDGSTMLSLTLTSDMLGKGGDKVCQLLMTKDSIVRKSSQFRAYVGASNDINSTAPDSATIIIISEKITELVHEAALDAIGEVQEVIDSIPPDYSALSGDITQLKADLSDVNERLTPYNAVNALIPYPTTASTYNGVTWTWNGDTCSYSGTATGTSFYWLYFVDRYHMPAWMETGKSYKVLCSTTDSDVALGFVFYKNGEVLGSENRFTSDGLLTVPSDAQGVNIRFSVKNAEANGTIKASVITAKTNAELTNAYDSIVSDVNSLIASKFIGQKGIIPSNTDFDTLKTAGYYLVNSNYGYTNNPLPVDKSGHLIVYPTTTNTILQLIISATTKKIYLRQSLFGTFSNNWQKIPDENQYVYNNYENTYNITSTPTITTDTNNYLAPTGDTTDMTGAIQTMLNSNGVCNLGPGDFYVTGIDIPTNATLKGSGTKTRIILGSSVTNGYAVKLRTYSCIKDLQILGQTAQYTPSGTIGTRNGIIWQGTADASTNPTTYYRSTIENVIIANFNGSAIKCYNTGGNVATNLHVTDVYIYWCDAGVNVAYYSEFHRFTNVSVTGCYYGCIDNGGNCNFANCDFSGNTVGLLINNSNNQSTNNSHGTFSACSFNHSGNNNGTAIRILKATAGEIFTGCQIFFGGIEIVDSIGIRFIGANVGRQVPITVTGSTVVSFDNSTFYDGSSSTLTQSNNTVLKFTECYLRAGTVYNPMSN